MKTAMFCLLASAAACYVFGFPVYAQLLKWNVIDKPNERSSHAQATVRGGGIGIVIAVIFGSILLLSRGTESKMLTVLAPFALLVAAVSFVDDLKSVSACVRFGCHALAGLAALYVLFPVPSTLTFLLTLTSLLWLVGYTNAFNFMDGINGIATGQAIITGIASAAIAVAGGASWTALPVLFACIVAGAAAGFLPHNFPRARMFMGDVSSAPLGFLLAALALWISKEFGWWLVIPLVLLHANFVLDTTITLCRRVAKQERWFAAHREHFYQRLVRSGKSHSFVTGLEMGLQVVVFGLMVIYVFSSPFWRGMLIAGVMGIWLSFFVYCEVQFQRSAREADAVTRPMPRERARVGA